MQRRQFLTAAGLGLTALSLAPHHAVAARRLREPVDTAARKRLADVALQAAREAGASYCDVRIGRYLNQALMTREDKVQDIVHGESSGCSAPTPNRAPDRI